MLAPLQDTEMTNISKFILGEISSEEMLSTFGKIQHEKGKRARLPLIYNFLGSTEGMKEEEEGEEEEEEKNKAGRKTLKTYNVTKGNHFYIQLTFSDLSSFFTKFTQEIVIKPDSISCKFNFITFAHEKTPKVEWLSSHLSSSGFFFVLCRSYDQSYQSVHLLKSHFGKLTEYFIMGYRGLLDSTSAFQQDTIIVQVWGHKKKIGELLKFSASDWPSGTLEYLCKYL